MLCCVVLQADDIRDLIDEIRHTPPVIAPMGMFEVGYHLIPWVTRLNSFNFGANENVVCTY